MYALVVAREHGGEAELLATARTLPAMKRKWCKLLDNVDHPYSCVGILTSKGLVNYFGHKIDHGQLGWIEIKMGVNHESAD